MTIHKYVRYTLGAEGTETYGLLDGETIHELQGNFLTTQETNGTTHQLAAVKLLPPTVPTKIVCIGRNYKAHAEERGNKVPEEPMMFLKPPSAMIGTGDEIVLPSIARNVEFEGELAIVIGKRLYQAESEAEARDAIFGITCLNDVSERFYQAKDGQWGRAKGFNTFAPAGPCVATGLDWQNLPIETKVNGVVKQAGHTSDMIFPIDYLVKFISHVMTLEPGDIITTGTPAGVGPLTSGDTVEITIEGVGTLLNTVK